MVPPILVKLYTYQLLRSIAYIHAKGICHRDIKPQNIFITNQDGRRVYKIGDFNVSKILDPAKTTVSNLHTSIQGTDGYFSPELQESWNRFKNNAGPRKILFNPSKSDVYSLGLLFLQMATFQSVGNLNTSEKQLDLNSMIDRLDYSAVFKDLVSAMLQYNVESRPTFSRLKYMLPGNITASIS